MAYKELKIVKGTSFTEEFQVIDGEGNVISLVENEVLFILKESESTEVDVFNMLLPVIDAEYGMYKIDLSSIQTQLDFKFGTYTMYLRTKAPLAPNTLPILQGPVEITQGS